MTRVGHSPDDHRRLGHGGGPRVLEQPGLGPGEGSVRVVEQRLDLRRVEVASGDAPAVLALEDLEVLVGRAAPPAPPAARAVRPRPGSSPRSAGRIRRVVGSALGPVLEVGFQEAMAVGPAAPEPEVMIEQGQVLPGLRPAQPAVAPQGVEVDHEELGHRGRRRAGRGCCRDGSRCGAGPALCSRAVRTASAVASRWRIRDRSRLGPGRRDGSRGTRRGGWSPGSPG